MIKIIRSNNPDWKEGDIVTVDLYKGLESRKGVDRRVGNLQVAVGGLALPVFHDVILGNIVYFKELDKQGARKVFDKSLIVKK